ncbi:MAG: peptidoglycan-binding protein [Natronospirillum sp.]
MVRRTRKAKTIINVWPGYVDALSALLMLVIFMLLIYSVSQLFLSQTLSDRDAELSRLNNRLAEISRLLRLEEERAADLQTELGQLQSAYDMSLSRGDLLQTEVDRLQDRVEADRDTIEVMLGTQASLQQDILALRTLREELEAEVGDLAGLLAARESDLEDARDSIGALRDRSQTLQAALADEQERTLLSQRELEAREIRIEDLVAVVDAGTDALDNEKQLSASQRAQIERLSNQISALQEQLRSISAALRLEESVTQEQETELSELGARLNSLLAQRVGELEQYQSEFFRQLREALAGNANVRIIGDRFLLPSELLFGSGSAIVGTTGQGELDKLADLLLELTRTIPEDIDWIIRIDGHTDLVPINTSQFPSNWELSTARAVSVVRYLADQGVPPRRMVAAGFGEFQPVEEGFSEEALQRNRRIEIKLTDR